VWGYALLWFLVNDRVKLLAYRIFDPAGAKSNKPDAKAEPKADAKAEPEPDAKAEPKPDAKAEPEPDAKAEPKPDANGKTPSDLTPQIAARAYELYEGEGHHDGHSVQDWEKAEREVRKDDAKAETKPDAKATEPKPDAKATEPKPDAKATEPKPDAKAAEPKPDAKAADPDPDSKPKTPSDLTPQLVKRVHELYENLGREEVRAVEDLEKTKRKVQEHEDHK
jgi:hypothetical protein